MFWGNRWRRLSFVQSLLGAEEHFKAKPPLSEILQLNWSRYFETSFKLQIGPEGSL